MYVVVGVILPRPRLTPSSRLMVYHAAGVSPHSLALTPSHANNSPNIGRRIDASHRVQVRGYGCTLAPAKQSISLLFLIQRNEIYTKYGIKHRRGGGGMTFNADHQAISSNNHLKSFSRGLSVSGENVAGL